jgi:hypothetical protein
VTPYRCRRDPDEVTLARGPHRGELPHAPATANVELVLERAPRAVALDGLPVPEGERGWRYDAARNLLSCTLAVPDGPWCLRAWTG